MTPFVLRFRTGSASAFAALFGLFFPRQVGNASRALGPAYPGRADPEDVALSAFYALWREVAAGRFADRLDSTAGFLAVIGILTSQKVARAIRHDRQRCRDVRRTIRFDDGAAMTARSHEVPPGDALADLPHSLTDRQREITRLRVAGWLVGEIAGRLSCSKRTVLRELELVRRLLGDTELG